MRAHRIALGALLLLGCAAPRPASATGAVPPPAPAELVLRGGAVYTVDAARSWAEAVAIRGGRIVFVGANRDVGAFIGSATKVVELGGKMLLPGFIDTHIHPRGGNGLADVKLEGVFDRAEVIRRIRAWAAAHPERPWVIGRGWEVGAFKPAGVPTRQLLDELVPDRPAYLRASDGHTGWANSKALALAGITRDTPNPMNGIIGKDKRSGEPDGVLYEEAGELVMKKVPEKTRAEWIAGQRLFLAELRRSGITSIMDAGTEDEPIAVTEEMARRGEQTARTVICQYYDPVIPDDDKQLRHFEEVRRRLPKGDLRATCVKILLDGIIEQYTGRLISPYLDGPKTVGPIFVEPPRLKRVVQKLDAAGFQVHIHAIGDGAVHEALDAFAAARAANGHADHRHIIAHLQLVDPGDLGRLRALGVIASMTPIWSRGDDLEVLFAAPRLGAKRARYLLPHRSILAAGSRIAWGTDWPVTSLYPLEGIETAVTRQYVGGVDPAGKPDKTWIPEETLTLEQTLAAYTIDAAYALFAEHERGSIEVGKQADLAVLDRNLFDVPPLKLHEVKVVMTVLGGRIIFDRASAE